MKSDVLQTRTGRDKVFHRKRCRTVSTRGQSRLVQVIKLGLTRVTLNVCEPCSQSVLKNLNRRRLQDTLHVLGLFYGSTTCFVLASLISFFIILLKIQR